jgi:hypothetical protein
MHNRKVPEQYCHSPGRTAISNHNYFARFKIQVAVLDGIGQNPGDIDCTVLEVSEQIRQPRPYLRRAMRPGPLGHRLALAVVLASGWSWRNKEQDLNR